MQGRLVPAVDVHRIATRHPRPRSVDDPPREKPLPDPTRHRGKVWVDRFDTALVAMGSTGGLSRRSRRKPQSDVEWIERSGPSVAGRDHAHRGGHLHHLRPGRAAGFAARVDHSRPVPPRRRPGQPCDHRLPARAGLAPPWSPRPQSRSASGRNGTAAPRRREFDRR